MGFVLDSVFRVLQSPSAAAAAAELLRLATPLWAAAIVGVLIGWAWRPRWVAGLVRSASAARIPTPTFSYLPRMEFWKSRCGETDAAAAVRQSEAPVEGDGLAVTSDDLAQLLRLVNGHDAGPVWMPMMEKSLQNMAYKAWWRDPENGPSEYRSRTVFEDASPEEVRDFFWDDEFRMSNRWDDMLISHERLQFCPATGTAVVRWVRKFPFFCKDREYIIGRRIWKLGRTYYCITKGVPCSSVERRSTPRRVNLYYSSWCIRPVQSRDNNDGRQSACEVLLFHHEDMGIPREIAKLGVRKGMWGCVKRIEPGLREYQAARITNNPPSQSALMARINTNVGQDFVHLVQSESTELEMTAITAKPHWTHNVPRFALLGGAVALACTLDQGLVAKMIVFGVARRLMKQRKSVT